MDIIFNFPKLRKKSWKLKKYCKSFLEYSVLDPRKPPIWLVFFAKLHNFLEFEWKK